MLSKFKKNISHSCIETFENCPRAWYFRYIERLYPEVEDDGSSNFGSLVHDIAENFEGKSIKELFNCCKERLKFFNELNDEYKPKFKPTILNFFDYYKNNLYGIKKRHIRKEIKLFVENFIDEFNLTGLIDLLIVKNKVIIIADYKTNKKVKDHTKQLSFYFLMLKLNDTIKKDNMECEIIYLCLGDDAEMKIEKYILTEKDIDDAITRIEIFIDKISKLGDEKENYRLKVGPLCDYCDYKKSKDCPAKNESNNLLENKMKKIIMNKKKRKGICHGVQS